MYTTHYNLKETPFNQSADPKYTWLSKKHSEALLAIKKDFLENVAVVPNPYIAAEMGYIDDIIEPQETRPRIINALHTLLNKREERPDKKHGNIPL